MNASARWTVAALAAPVVLLSFSLARADYYQAPYGPGGAWRIYETPRAGQTFRDALADAQAAMDPVTGSVPGSLVSVTSLGKNVFLQRSIGRAPGDNWIGLTDREGAAPGAFESQGEADNRASGWAWTNGDEYSFYNWGAGEPNDAGGEDATQMRGDGMWNDNKSGFFDSDPIAAEMKAGTSADEATGLAYPYMVEYAVDSPTPLPGIRYGMVFPPCATFPIPPNTAGNWSVREIRGLTLAGNAFDAVEKAIAGTGEEIRDAQSPYLDFTDPDTNANGGGILTTTPFPFLSNDLETPNQDDDNILSVAKTRFHIDPANAGTYSVQVHGDDGFAMRIKGVPWVSVAGDNRDTGRGYIDPLDPTAIVFERGTGDSNTVATIDLGAGDYDVEFIAWEGGGGAYYEVTAAKGDAVGGNALQWQPFGSNISLPEVNTINTVHMTAPATVHNANLRDRANALPAMRYYIDNVDGATAVKETLQIGEGDMPNNNGGDNYVTKVTGTITVDADANANSTTGELIDVTFRLNCDDGASMRIIGQDFLAVNGGGENNGVRSLIDNGGDMTMSADFPTGNTNVRGRIQLTEGQSYEIVCYMYEYGGGSNFNLYWQVGDYVDSDLDAPVALSSFGEIALTSEPDPVNFPGTLGALVENTRIPGSNEDTLANPTLPATRAIVAEAIAQGITYTGTTPIVVLRDDADICCGRPGNNIFASSVEMPIGLGQDNYVTKVLGSFVVDNQNGTPNESITLTFGVFADDGADLHIIGQNFTSAGGSGALQINGADTWLVADFYTGNTNALGVITLTEGTYTFESHEYEGGGGSGLEIFWATGEFTAYDQANFRPLTDDAGFFLPASPGIPLIAALDNDADDDGMPAAFETANGLSDSDPADAAQDKDGDGATNLDEYIAGTDPGNAASVLRIGDVQLVSGGLQITAPVKAGHHYHLEGSSNLQPAWTEFGRALPATDGTVTWTVPSPDVAPEKYFFRVKVDACP